VYGEVLIFSIFIFLKVGGKNADQPRVMIFTEKNVRVIMQSYIPVYIFFFKECFFSQRMSALSCSLIFRYTFFFVMYTLHIRCVYIIYIYIILYDICGEESVYVIYLFIYLFIL